MDARFGLLSQQFENYKKDMDNYKVYINKALKERLNVRQGGDEANPGYRQ